MLDPATRQQLTQTLEAHEKATGEQVVVVTVPGLQGTAIEDYGYQLGRAWGIGQKDKNNGALLIVARDDRKLRIEVGYGLEDRLTGCAVVRHPQPGHYPGVQEWTVQSGHQRRCRGDPASTGRRPTG